MKVKFQFLGWRRFNDFKNLHKNLKIVFPLEFQSGYNEFVKGHFFSKLFIERIDKIDIIDQNGHPLI